MASILPHGEGFRAFIQIKGFPRKTKTFATQEEAQTWAKAEEALLKPRSTAYSHDDDTITLKECFAKYVELAGPDKRPSTLKREKQAARVVLEKLGDYAIKNISHIIIQRYFDKRRQEKSARGAPLAADSLRLEKAIMRNLFNFALSRGYVATSPIQGRIYLPKCKPRESRIHVEEQLRLIEEATKTISGINGRRGNPCLVAWIETMFMLGMRPGECSRLRTEWVRIEGINLTIDVPSNQTKNGKPRKIVIGYANLPTVLAQFNRAKAANSPYLFFSKNYKTKDFVPYAYGSAFKRIANKAGVSGIVAHSIRHEVISRLIEKTNFSESQIAAIIGHDNVASLAPYKHLLVERLKAEIDTYASNEQERLKTESETEEVFTFGEVPE